eukprot:352484-Chlamydomonas_euryale.AAC.4
MVRRGACRSILAICQWLRVLGRCTGASGAGGLSVNPCSNGRPARAAPGATALACHADGVAASTDLACHADGAVVGAAAFACHADSGAAATSALACRADGAAAAAATTLAHAALGAGADSIGAPTSGHSTAAACNVAAASGLIETDSGAVAAPGACSRSTVCAGSKEGAQARCADGGCEEGVNVRCGTSRTALGLIRRGSTARPCCCCCCCCCACCCCCCCTCACLDARSCCGCCTRRCSSRRAAAAAPTGFPCIRASSACCFAFCRAPQAPCSFGLATGAAASLAPAAPLSWNGSAQAVLPLARASVVCPTSSGSASLLRGSWHPPCRASAWQRPAWGADGAAAHCIERAEGAERSASLPAGTVSTCTGEGRQPGRHAWAASTDTVREHLHGGHFVIRKS